MRRSVLLVVLLLSLPQTAMAVGVTLTASKANVAPGGINSLTLVVTNIGSTPLTGRLQADVESNGASLLDGGSANNTAVKCQLTATTTGPLFSRCTADSITLAPGASVTTTVDLFIPSSTATGTEIRSTATVTMQTSQQQFDETATVTFRVGTSGGPILAIEIIRTRNMESENSYAYEAIYDIRIKNVGSAPTTGPITVDATVEWPPGDVQTLPVDDYPGVLQPNETISRVTYRLLSGRGEFAFTAVASGGGAPRVEKTDILVLDPRTVIPEVAKYPLIVGGRRP